MFGINAKRTASETNSFLLLDIVDYVETLSVYELYTFMNTVLLILA